MRALLASLTIASGMVLAQAVQRPSTPQTVTLDPLSTGAIDNPDAGAVIITSAVKTPTIGAVDAGYLTVSGAGGSFSDVRTPTVTSQDAGYVTVVGVGASAHDVKVATVTSEDAGTVTVVGTSVTATKGVFTAASGAHGVEVTDGAKICLDGNPCTKALTSTTAPRVLTGSASHNFGPMDASSGCEFFTATVTGAVVGNRVLCTWDLTSTDAFFIIGACKVSAANTVEVRVCCIDSSPEDPPNIAFDFTVFQQ